MALIIHNVLWSSYKGAVFTELNKLANKTGFVVDFIHLAETESNRNSLKKVDYSFHQYQFKLLKKGVLNDKFDFEVMIGLMKICLTTNESLVVLPGYNRLEYWLALLVLLIRKKKLGLFVDSTKTDNKKVFYKHYLKSLFIKFTTINFCYGLKSKEYLLSLGAKESSIVLRCQAAALPQGFSFDNVKDKRLLNLSNGYDKNLFLYVGRLSSEKSIDVLIEAFSSIRHLLPNSKLMLIGSGPLKNQLIELSISLGMESHIVFHGPANLDYIFNQYAKAVCLILPSKSEPWGLVVNEALSSGCPVLVSDACGCVPELVIDKVTGVTFKSGDKIDLAQKILSINEIFSDPSKTVDDCLKQINKFSPEMAAKQIFNGLMAHD